MHLTEGVPPVIRIHGRLRYYGANELTAEQLEEMARALLTDLQWQRLKEQGELDLSYELEGVSRYRLNIYHQRARLSLAIRVIPTRIPSMEQLDLPVVLKELAKKPQGLFLVTGSTGSGKSTTLASFIQYINQTDSKHIITLEDPIEYIHTHHQSVVNQREIGVDTQNFASGLRLSLRQDPDVILVGEMRDLETISTAITAAETGHLVLATLHTTDAPSTIERIIDVFPPEQQTQIRIQLASVLIAVLSQRLFPTVDGQGRKIATEMLISNAAIANLIRSEKTHQIRSILQTSRAQGMHTLSMSMQELVSRVSSPQN